MNPSWETVLTPEGIRHLALDTSAIKMAAPAASEEGIEMGDHSNAMKKEDAPRSMGDMEYAIYQQVELMADEEHDSSTIKKKKRMARTALTMWKEQIQEVERRKEQWKTGINRNMNDVYQLVSLYSVFAGVVLTAVATSSRLECQHLWSPMGLCLFAYSMLIIVAVRKLQTIATLNKIMELEDFFHKVIWRCIQEMKRIGYDGFDYTQHVPKEQNLPRSQSRLWMKTLVIIVPLTVFTAGLVFSFVHILCWS